MAVAALAAIATLLVAPPASAAGTFDPPPGTELFPATSLPECSAAGASWISGYSLTDPVALLRGVGLGWRATVTGAFVNGAWASALTPIIPCQYLNGTKTQVVIPVYQTSLASSTGTPLTVANVTTTAICYNAAGTVELAPITVGGIAVKGVAGVGAGNFQAAVRVLTFTDCPLIRSITLLAQTVVAPIQSRVSAVWKSSFWNTSDGRYKIPTSADEIPDPWTGLELPVNCSFTPAGSDIFALWLDAFVKAGEWAVCLFTPVGWDRSNKIAAAWQDSPLGAFSDAFAAVMPSSLGCGVVATIPVWGSNVTLNTCAGDIAPDFVKVGVSWLLILSCGVASVRRVLWAVGSG